LDGHWVFNKGNQLCSYGFEEGKCDEDKIDKDSGANDENQSEGLLVSELVLTLVACEAQKDVEVQ
jgi:hypothetical protein